MTKTIVITSGKSGVGKTNISLNLALELSSRDYRTCLFDADFGLANVAILLGLRPEATFDDFILGDKKLQDIILHSTAGIDIIPGSSGIEEIANLAPNKIAALVSSFSELTGYDYFFIDTSSGISKSGIAFCLASSETIVVITSEATSLTEAYALIKVMAKNGYTGTVKVLVNKCADVPTSKRTYLRFKNAVDSHLDIDIAPAGIVLRDTHFESALQHQEPLLHLYPNSIGSQCIRSLVSILLFRNTIEEKSSDFGEFWKRYFDFSSSALSLPENLQEESEQIKPSTIKPPKEDESPTVLPHVVKPEPEKDMERLLSSSLEKSITMSTERPEQPDTEMQKQITEETFDFSLSALSLPENLQEESEQIEPSAIEQPKEDESPTVSPHVVQPEPEKDMERLLSSSLEAPITMSTERPEQPDTEMQKQITGEDIDFSLSALSLPENLQEESEQIEPSALEQPKEDESPTVLLHVVQPEPEKDMERLLQSSQKTPITISTERPGHPDAEMQRQITGEDIYSTLPSDGTTIDMQKLPSPIPLLSSCLDRQSRGALLQSEIFEMFSCDPALMLKSLGLLSPSPSQKPRRIVSIQQLLSKIGPGPLSTLLTSVTMQEALTESISDSHFVNRFWYHSYKAAVIAQKLAAVTNYPYPEEAYLSGLIHDIGRLAFQTSSPEIYSEYPLTFNTDLPSLKAEQQVFGSDHAEKGAACLQGLHLNSFVADAVRYHIEPESIITTAFDLVKIVSVASKLTELTRDNKEQALQLGTAILDISMEQLEECITKAEEKVDLVADRFQIDLMNEPEQQSSEDDRILFKKQAIDYTLLQGILPTPEPTRNLAQIIHRIHQGLHVLFGIQHALCLMPDQNSSILQAVGYQDCFGWEILPDITLSFTSLKSVIVRSFTSNEMKIVIETREADVLSLAERQIIHYLDSDGLACVPMVVDGKSLGMIIFGIKESEYNKISEQQGKLQQFGSQSARNIIFLEQITQPGQNDRPSSLPKTGNVQDDLLN